MIETWMIKYALAALPVVMFLYSLLSSRAEAEINHLLAAVMVLALPERFFAYPLQVAGLTIPLALYGVSLAASFLAILSGSHPRVPLDGPLPERLGHQMGRIINEEALFRGLMFLLPLALWGDGDRWVWFALPQAVLFALVHAVPVYLVLKGRGRAQRAVIGGFIFPFVGAMVIAYAGFLTGGLLVPLAVHFATNAAAELFFQVVGWKTVFAIGGLAPAADGR